MLLTQTSLHPEPTDTSNFELRAGLLDRVWVQLFVAAKLSAEVKLDQTIPSPSSLTRPFLFILGPFPRNNQQMQSTILAEAASEDCHSRTRVFQKRWWNTNDHRLHDVHVPVAVTVGREGAVVPGRSQEHEKTPSHMNTIFKLCPQCFQAMILKNKERLSYYSWFQD